MNRSLNVHMVALFTLIVLAGLSYLIVSMLQLGRPVRFTIYNFYEGCDGEIMVEDATASEQVCLDFEGLITEYSGRAYASVIFNCREQSLALYGTEGCEGEPDYASFEDVCLVKNYSFAIGDVRCIVS